jgi:hypothetical protein
MFYIQNNMSGNIAQLSNSVVLHILANRNNIQKSHIIQQLKKITPCITDDALQQLYDKSISLHQGSVQRNGSFLENDIIKEYLDANNIPYKSQVTIDKSGIVSGFNMKKSKCYHIIDFVLGVDINIGQPITAFKVLSCKTTCRERWTQDDWSIVFPPTKYLLITLSNDYPNSNRFCESEVRKIITCIPKIKDDRIYKLGFENLLEEII